MFFLGLMYVYLEKVVFFLLIVLSFEVVSWVGWGLFCLFCRRSFFREGCKLEISFGVFWM